MPENLTGKAKEIFLSAEASAKKTCPDGDAECIASKSWAAVKRGFRKEGDTWIPKNTAEFSFHIYRASLDKSTQEMRWFATASDIDDDSYDDNMTLELYADFLDRIKSKELPPERHRSEFWSGGMPYISVSHYLDLDGEGVPGDIESVFVDGKCLKSKGTFANTVLGKSCFDAVLNDLYAEEKSHSDKVRISIAFVDWAHRHKSNGFDFVRESLEDICLECIRELITGKSEGKEFLKGHLIHLALTRVPVNERTNMEVRSMVTQKEDAASIVGDELAEEINKKAGEVGKADLVIKADAEPVVERKMHDKEEDDDEEDKKKKKKKEEEEKSEVIEIKAEVVFESHPLDAFIESFRSSFDEIVARGLLSDDTLIALQEPFALLGENVKSIVQTPEDAQRAEENSKIDKLLAMVEAQNQSIQVLSTEVGILKQQSQATSHVAPTQSEETVRRSYQPRPIGDFMTPAPANKPLTAAEAARKSVYGSYQ